jgi:hypothetical protein
MTLAGPAVRLLSRVFQHSVFDVEYHLGAHSMAGEGLDVSKWEVRWPGRDQVIRGPGCVGGSVPGLGETVGRPRAALQREKDIRRWTGEAKCLEENVYEGLRIRDKRQQD